MNIANVITIKLQARIACSCFLPSNQTNLIFAGDYNKESMKRWSCKFLSGSTFLIGTSDLSAQCSICTKTASQLGEKQGKGLNGGIIYLMLMPFAIGGYIGYRWWKNEKVLQEIDAREN